MLFKVLVRVLACLALLVAGQSAAAQDMSALPRGAVFHWQVENGTTTVRYQGRDQRGYRFAFTRDASKGQSLKMIWWADTKGQILLAKAGRNETRFVPNDCSLTTGRCNYVRIEPDGRKQKIVNVTSVRNGLWSYRTYRDRVSPATLVESGTFTLDRFGVMIDRYYQLGDGKPRWSRRIRN